MILRPYQNLIMNDIYDGFNYKNQQLCVASMGAGKSLIISETARHYSNLGETVAILTNISELIPQLIYHFNEFNLKYKVIKSGYEFQKNDENIKIWLIMEQSFNEDKRVELELTCDILIKDECFTPDVEILTSNGFKKFGDISNQEIVAQYNEINEEISFVKPTKFINYEYSGDMILVESKRSISLSTTPNHEFLVKNNKKFQKVKAKELKKSSCMKIPVSGKATGYDKKLTIYEKLAIAFQADGIIHQIYRCNDRNIDSVVSRVGFIPKNEHCSIIFELSKKSKIDRFLKDFSDFNINELKQHKNTRRFLLSNIDLNKISKNLKDIFDISSFSLEKSLAFINYLVIWSGHISKKNRYYYSSKVKDNIDIVQEIATLSNMYSRTGIQKDNRNSNSSDIHRICINPTSNEITTQTFTKSVFNYVGQVFCVEVPTHNIIVRRGGKVVVVGNCHIGHNKKRFIDIKNSLNPKKYLGLSGTPFDENGFLLDGFDVNDLILHGEAKELTELGFLVPLRYFCVSWAENKDYSKVKKSGNDYSSSDLDKIINTFEHNSLIVRSMNEMKGKTKKTLVYCNSISQAEELTKLLIKDGYKAGVVHSKKNKKDNDLIISSFNNEIGQKDSIDCLVSISKLTTGFNQPKATLLVLCRPTKILRLYLQILFRVARTHPGKDFAEVLDLSQSLKTHGFGTEPRSYISKENKEELKKQKEKLSKPCIPNLVSSSPTEITLEAVTLKMKELKVKQLDIKRNSLTNLIKIYMNSLDLNIIINIIYELNFRSNKVFYSENEVIAQSHIFMLKYEKMKELRIPHLLDLWKEQLRFHIKEKKEISLFEPKV